MLSTTVDVIKGAITLDPTLSDPDRKHLISFVRDFKSGKNANRDEPATRKSIVPYREAAERLGCSVATIRRLRRIGVLVGVTYGGVNHHGVTEASLSAILEGNAA